MSRRTNRGNILAQRKASTESKRTNTASKSKKTGQASRQTAQSSKTTAARKTPRKENKRTAAKKKSFVKTEVSSILLIAAGVFFLLTDFGFMGKVGAVIMTLQRGLFGQACYLFGIALACFAAASYFERGKYLRGLKLVSIAAAFLSLTAIIQLMFAERAGDGSVLIKSLSELYINGASGAKGGGAVGGFIANTLHQVLGYVGAYLILIVLLIICIVIITEKSFVSAAKVGAEKTADAVKAGAGKTFEAAKEGHERYVQHQSERERIREEERRRRAEEKENAEHRRTEQSLSSLTLEPGNPSVNDAEDYIRYGREIIGSGQPGIDDLGTVKEPLFRKKHRSVKDNSKTNFDTAVINVLPEELDVKQRPVNIKEINYDDDSVPFDETEEEKYRSYAGIIDSGCFNAETAGMAGFAAGSTIHNVDAGNEASIDAPQSFAAFRDAKPEITFSGFNFNEDGETEEALSASDQTEIEAAVTKDSAEHAAERYLSRGPSPIVFANDHEDDVSDDASEENISEDSLTDDIIYAKGSTEDIKYGPDGFAIYNNSGSQGYDAGEDQSPAADLNPDGNTEPETYLSGTGKEMQTPDSYEAELIMKAKRANRAAADEMHTAAESSAEAVRAASERVENANAADSGSKTSIKEAPKPKPKPRPYVFPKIDLLEKGKKAASDSREEILDNAHKLEQLLRDFGVGASVTNVIRGPRVCRYEIIPDTGVKVSRITGLADDIKLALAAAELRIEAPIPGKSAVGIEVPNSAGQTVRFRDILESEEFKNAKSKLSWGVGLDINGKPVIADIAKMPHLLVAGTTGSGKSVGINSLIMSILYRATPDDVRMILVDPKVVELSVYNGIPHLLTDVVTKPDRALSALNWAVAEMNNRYKLFQQSATRNISGYNEKVEKTLEKLPEDTPDEEKPKKLPYILIIIDELSELMMHSKKDVESAIVSLTQLARAAGLHLVVATQRPSVDVITGLIKSNIPSRIAYRLPSQTDSRTILDSGGAETLLGNGDMLYKPGDKNSPSRVQGAFLSDDEVENVVEYLRKHNGEALDNAEFDEAINTQMELDLNAAAGDIAGGVSDTDEYFAEAGRLIINTKKASIGALQRKFKIGFNRAARIMDQLHEAGVVSDSEGTKERQILMELSEFEEMLNGQGN